MIREVYSTISPPGFFYNEVIDVEYFRFYIDKPPDDYAVGLYTGILMKPGERRDVSLVKNVNKDSLFYKEGTQTGKCIRNAIQFNSIDESIEGLLREDFNDNKIILVMACKKYE